MKAEGIEYDERMELLEDVTLSTSRWPSCSTAAFEIYRKGHPWLSDYELSPKSVVRDMCERAMTFTEYVAFYGLARSRGTGAALPGRRLPGAARLACPRRRAPRRSTDLTDWLGELVRQVDSSLLDEWEQLTAPRRGRRRRLAEVDARRCRSPANVRAFIVLVRNAMFRRVELAALHRYDDLGELDADDGWNADAWREALEGYYAEHDRIGTGAGCRGSGPAAHRPQPDRWLVRQVFDDPDGDHDWGISAEVDLAASDEAGSRQRRGSDHDCRLSRK